MEVEGSAAYLQRFVAEGDWYDGIVLGSLLPAGSWESLPRPVKAWLRNYIGGVILYFLSGFLWCFYIYYWKRNVYLSKDAIPTKDAMRLQIIVAMKAMPWYVALPTLSEYMVESGWTNCYSSIYEVGWPMYLVYTVTYLAMCEFGIYWMHRELHDIKTLYKYLHATHHIYNKQNTLSPFAGLAFHPLDGILQAVPHVISLFIVPTQFMTHMLLLFCEAVWTANIHDCIHGKVWPVMGAGYHTIHHTTYRHNYGHYTIWMDWMFGTLRDPEEDLDVKKISYALESECIDMEIDLSNLGTVNTMFATLFSKLGVPIKTTVSTAVLEETLSGTITVRPLLLGRSFSRKVKKQYADFFGVTVSDHQAEAGIVVRVILAVESKFKEDSKKTGKITSAGMYFLHFQVYRMDSTVNALAMAKDPEAALFKKLEGLQPCEVSELKPGTHIFAVYGDNFFKMATYTIEALCSLSYEDVSENLKEIEAHLLMKRNDLRQFEADYRKALMRFQQVTNRYCQEKQSVDELLNQRETLRSSFTKIGVVMNPGEVNSISQAPPDDFKVKNPAEDEP